MKLKNYYGAHIKEPCKFCEYGLYSQYDDPCNTCIELNHSKPGLKSKFKQASSCFDTHLPLTEPTPEEIMEMRIQELENMVQHLMCLLSDIK